MSFTTEPHPLPTPSYSQSAQTLYHTTSTLNLPARTTHISKDLTTTMALNNYYTPSHPHQAITAACIYAAAWLMREEEPVKVEDIMRVLGVESERVFWEAYARVWEKREELVTGEVQCHGADVGRLPVPKSTRENGAEMFRKVFL